MNQQLVGGRVVFENGCKHALLEATGLVDLAAAHGFWTMIAQSQDERPRFVNKKFFDIDISVQEVRIATDCFMAQGVGWTCGVLVEKCHLCRRIADISKDLSRITPEMSEEEVKVSQCGIVQVVSAVEILLWHVHGSVDGEDFVDSGKDLNATKVGMIIVVTRSIEGQMARAVFCEAKERSRQRLECVVGVRFGHTPTSRSGDMSADEGHDVNDRRVRGTTGEGEIKEQRE